MIKIGSYTLPSNVLLAPMAGVTDLPFRLISRKHGAKFAFFEMIDMNSVIHGTHLKNNDIIKTTAKDKPIAVQLVGSDPEMMLKAAQELIEKLDVKFLDINAACPVKKMVQKKAGAFLIKEPENLYRTLELLTSKLDIPVTVKLRTGYTKPDHQWIADIAENCEKSGASALFVHGRTQKQGYSGDIDYEAIMAVKHSVRIPVFGSGNIFDPELAKKMLDLTDCDGVLVARGACGNPWIFGEIEEYLKTGKVSSKASIEVKLATLKEHMACIEEYVDMVPDSMLGYMRKVAQWYLKDFPNACNIRRVTNNAGTIAQLNAIIEKVPELTGKAGSCWLPSLEEAPRRSRGRPSLS
jgi:tRNA-dihydrouridine synthase B